VLTDLHVELLAREHSHSAHRSTCKVTGYGLDKQVAVPGLGFVIFLVTTSVHSECRILSATYGNWGMCLGVKIVPNLKLATHLYLKPIFRILEALFPVPCL